MTGPDAADPDRLRYLATFIAKAPMAVSLAAAGDRAHTDGHTIFVSAAAPPDEQRREMVVQAALLGAGSLDRRLVKRLRARPSVARRYLTLEGDRVLADLARHLPLAAKIATGERPRTHTPAESLDVAGSRSRIAEPPGWFGVIKPSSLLSARGNPGLQSADEDVRLEPKAGHDDRDDDGNVRESRLLRLFQTPVINSRSLSELLRQLFGAAPSSGGDHTAGGELRRGTIRKAQSAGPHARPLPTAIRFAHDVKPGTICGLRGTLHPEWDVHAERYRPDWCRVLEFPLTARVEAADASALQDDVLRRRLSRVGLGPKTLRARADGDELDVEALIELCVDLRSGQSPPELVYVERRNVARNLGVLILLDASGSATDADPRGLAVHDHQRRAAATLAATLQELGDRVAIYAFRSQGRDAVHLPVVKTFEQRFDAAARARLNQLQPSSYTRLGAAIRGAGGILKAEAGTPNRLLLVLSDGYPYDHGYEGRYAESDANRALEELRTDGVACLCLSIGATATDARALERVFGAASYACAATLAELSPRMDELFMWALRELAAQRLAPRPR